MIISYIPKFQNKMKITHVNLQEYVKPKQQKKEVNPKKNSTQNKMNTYIKSSNYSKINNLKEIFFQIIFKFKFNLRPAYGRKFMQL